MNQKNFIQSLNSASRAGLVAGMVLLALLMALAGWWWLRPEYQVLFNRLSQRDAAALSKELDALKVPYQVQEGGTILVESSQVHRLRMQLMSRDVGLQGTVGFEIFNNADVGMSEYSQRIAYLRAVQGELTRTIAALGEIESVRVHLALPEESLFKRNAQRAKAAVTVAMKPGEELAQAQVVGIQRLVAAAVPSIGESDVTVIDQHGTALTRRAPKDLGDAAGGTERLEVKRDMEQHLSRKAVAVLDRLLGAGSAEVAVDAEVSFVQSKVTSEEVLPAGQRGPGAAGVLVRERSMHSEMAKPMAATQATGASTSSGSQQREADYAVGRRVEQLVQPAGEIKRIQAAVVLGADTEPRVVEQARGLVTAALGLVPARGDTLVVHVMQRPLAPTVRATSAATERPALAPEPPRAAPPHTGVPMTVISLMALLVLFLLAAVVYLLIGHERQRRLSAAEREQLLDRLESWLGSGSEEVGRSKA